MKYLSITLCSSAVLAVILYIFSVPLLNGAGQALVRNDTIQPSDCLVILAGDTTGERMRGAIKLWKKGYAGKIVFWSGSREYSERIFRQMEENEVQRNQILWSDQRLTEDSTYGEALVNIRLLKQVHARSFILVTSDYHTARSGRIYSFLAKKNGMTLCVYPVQSKEVTLDKWWRNPVDRKEVLREWQKTIWYLLRYHE
jgi:uncharacterized SAM-binding protein YcdF (DUF218 family)